MYNIFFFLNKKKKREKKSIEEKIDFSLNKFW